MHLITLYFESFYFFELICRERARKNSFNCVGLDVEWKPNFRKGQPPNKAALLQICPDGEKCYVFHIFHIVRKLGKSVKVYFSV